MNIAAISTAIASRIAADTADGGLNGATNKLLSGAQGSGFWLDMAPPTAVMPYLVWVFGINAPNHTFPNDGGDGLLEFYLYTDRRADFDDASDIIERIIGDAMANDPPVPTYGFHRHILSITGHTATSCVLQSADSASDEDKRIWRVAFTLSIWKSSTA